MRVVQAYGDAVTDECPLLLVSNYHTTILLQRNVENVGDKTLQAAQWAWDSTDVPPLGAFLYVLKCAHDLWRTGAKQRLPRLGVIPTPPHRYRLVLGGRPVQMAAKFGGYRPEPEREQPSRGAAGCMRRHTLGDHAGANVRHAGSQSAYPSDAQLETFSSNDSIVSDSLNSSTYHSDSSNDDGNDYFDVSAWADAAVAGANSKCGLLKAVESLPFLPPSYADDSGPCLSSTCNHRVFQVGIWSRKLCVMCC